MPPAARLTDLHPCAFALGAPTPITAPGCPTVMIEFMPAARVSDLAGCGSMVAHGSMTVQIGFMPAARVGDPVGATVLIPMPFGPPISIFVPCGAIVPPCATTVWIGDAGGPGGGAGGGAVGVPPAPAPPPSAGGAAPAGATDSPAEAAKPGETKPAKAPLATHYVQIELYHRDDRTLFEGQKYQVITPDGQPRKGGLDDSGFRMIDDIAEGMCQVSFPDIDKTLRKRKSKDKPK